MKREITFEQYEALEREHGQGMVLLYTVGEADFAFRRLNETEARLVDGMIASKLLSAHEQMAVRCLLVPELPDANKTGSAEPAEPSPTSDALKVERGRLEWLFRDAPVMRDVIGMDLAKDCGWQWLVTAEDAGGGRRRVLLQRTAISGEELVGLPGSSSEESPTAEQPERIELFGRRPEPLEYGQYRQLLCTEGELAAGWLAFDLLVEPSEAKSMVKRQFVHAVRLVGDSLAASGLVLPSKKKFPSSPPKGAARGDSSSPPAAATS